MNAGQPVTNVNTTVLPTARITTPAPAQRVAETSRSTTTGRGLLIAATAA